MADGLTRFQITTEEVSGNMWGVGIDDATHERLVQEAETEIIDSGDVLVVHLKVRKAISSALDQKGVPETGERVNQAVENPRGRTDSADVDLAACSIILAAVNALIKKGGLEKQPGI